MFDIRHGRGTRCCWLPSVATLALVAVVGGCTSLFTNGGESWTRKDGAPTCSPAPSLVLDSVIGAVGLALLGMTKKACGGDDPYCGMIVGAPGIMLTVGAIPGVVAGSYNVRSCSRAKRAWARSERNVTRELAGATGSETDVYGDTLIFRAPTVEECNSLDWLRAARSRRQELAARGLTFAVCRSGGVEHWAGPVEL
jgi:hypothetical protein